ncbi:MAG: hypothetical protein LBU15_01535 [Rickettsiales bacterium]|jgi:hypothetical protein|nr:hypothetical protein [Rickettsiales bacterium]
MCVNKDSLSLALLVLSLGITAKPKVADASFLGKVAKTVRFGGEKSKTKGKKVKKEESKEVKEYSSEVNGKSKETEGKKGKKRKKRELKEDEIEEKETPLGGRIGTIQIGTEQNIILNMDQKKITPRGTSSFSKMRSIVGSLTYNPFFELRHHHIALASGPSGGRIPPPFLLPSSPGDHSRGRNEFEGERQGKPDGHSNSKKVNNMSLSPEVAGSNFPRSRKIEKVVAMMAMAMAGWLGYRLVVEEKTGPAKKETGLANRDSSINETGLAANGTGLVKEETGLANRDSSINETGLAANGTELVKEEAGLANRDSSINETGLAANGTGLVKEEAGLANRDSSINGTGLAANGTGLAKEEAGLANRDSSIHGTGLAANGTVLAANGTVLAANGTVLAASGAEPANGTELVKEEAGSEGKASPEAGTGTHQKNENSEEDKEIIQPEEDPSRQKTSASASGDHLQDAAVETRHRRKQKRKQKQETVALDGENEPGQGALGPERQVLEPEPNVCHICRALGLVPGAIY